MNESIKNYQFAIEDQILKAEVWYNQNIMSCKHYEKISLLNNSISGLISFAFVSTALWLWQISGSSFSTNISIVVAFLGFIQASLLSIDMYISPGQLASGHSETARQTANLIARWNNLNVQASTGSKTLRSIADGFDELLLEQNNITAQSRAIPKHIIDREKTRPGRTDPELPPSVTYSTDIPSSLRPNVSEQQP